MVEATLLKYVSVSCLEKKLVNVVYSTFLILQPSASEYTLRSASNSLPKHCILSKGYKQNAGMEAAATLYPGNHSLILIFIYVFA